MSGQPALKSNHFIGVDASDLKVLKENDKTPGDFVFSGTKPLKLSLTLEFDGLFAPVLLCCLCWKIVYCFDVCCGPHGKGGKRFCFPDRRCGRADKLTYEGEDTQVIVPPNELAPDTTYRIIAIVKFWQRCDGKDIRVRPLAAFTDGPMIEITG